MQSKPLQAFGIVFIVGCMFIGGLNIYLKHAKPVPNPDDPIVVNVETETRKTRDTYLNAVADVMEKYSNKSLAKPTVKEQGEQVYTETGPLLDQWRKAQNDIIVSQVGTTDLSPEKNEVLMKDMAKGTRP